MNTIRLVAGVLLATFVAGCVSTRYVHPTKKEEALASDQMSCEREFAQLMTTNPGVASVHTNQTIARQRMDACLYKKGWKKIEE
ncbi:MAG: hypothetical protein U0172_12765 [Nitrospiraceae bacterium]